MICTVMQLVNGSASMMFVLMIICQLQYTTANTNQLLHQRNPPINNRQMYVQPIKPLKSPATKSCEPIRIPMCQKLRYNLTSMPNMFGDESQQEAGFEVHQYYPLVQLQCSDDLQFFLCSVYIPICLKDYSKRLQPCRSVCERVKKGCEPVLNKISFKWPAKMNCSQFPEYNSPNGDLCMERDLDSSLDYNSKSYESKENEAQINYNPDNLIKQLAQHRLSNIVSARLSKQRSSRVFCDCSCRKPLVSILEVNKAHFNQVFTTGLPNCAQPCHSSSFNSESDKKFFSFWIGTWSIICMITTTIMLITFSLDPSRYRYPERPIIFMGLCYFFMSLGFVLRLMLGHERVACDKLSNTDAIPSTKHTASDVFILANSHSMSSGGGTSVSCIVVFILVYYFSMAASLWWVVLSFTWFLAAGLKWSSEAISKYAQIYHFFAWIVPGILTMLALALSSIEGDALSGICFIGTSPQITNGLVVEATPKLLGFVVVPMALLLSTGTLLLLAGFSSMLRIRRIIRLQHDLHSHQQQQQQAIIIPSSITSSSCCSGGGVTGGGGPGIIGSTSIHTNKTIDKAAAQLQKLTWRIGIFGILFILPNAVTLACFCYETYYQSVWQQNTACHCYNPLQPGSNKIQLDQSSQTLSLLKYFMFISVGISVACWVLSKKTIVSWYNACCYLGYCCCCCCCCSHFNSKRNKFFNHSNDHIHNHHQNHIQSTNHLHHQYNHHLNASGLKNAQSLLNSKASPGQFCSSSATGPFSSLLSSSSKYNNNNIDNNNIDHHSQQKILCYSSSQHLNGSATSSSSRNLLLSNQMFPMAPSVPLPTPPQSQVASSSSHSLGLPSYNI